MKKKISKEQALILHIKLSWEILEHKWRYYVGRAQSAKVKCIPDEEYDKVEKVYERLCALLECKPTATEVGFSFQQASRRAVHEKMCDLYGLDAKITWVG